MIYLLRCQGLEKGTVMNLLTIAMLKKNNYTDIWYLLGQQLILVIGFDMCVVRQCPFNTTVCLYYTAIFPAIQIVYILISSIYISIFKMFCKRHVSNNATYVYKLLWKLSYVSDIVI
jgi:hypothetical protein